MLVSVTRRERPAIPYSGGGIDTPQSSKRRLLLHPKKPAHHICMHPKKSMWLALILLK